MRRILLATDDSACSLQAVQQGADLLGTDACHVRVLSVIPSAEAGGAPGPHYHRAAEVAQEALDHAIDHLTLVGHTADGALKVGVPARAIVEAAVDFRADLIVVGTRGSRTGSVAVEVLRTATCGVLIYPLRGAVEA